MSINKYKKHILVLPEDDVNRQIANGFLLEQNLNLRAIQILVPAGGWTKTLESFNKNHVAEMSKHPNRMMLLLVDFDKDKDRSTGMKSNIPSELHDRVFILGAYSEPEDLKKKIKNLNTFEKIGKSEKIEK